MYSFNMKLRLFIIFFSTGFLVQAQNQNFSNLFKPVASICWENEKMIMKQLQAPEFNPYMSDSLIDLWESYCGANEASIRSRLVFDLKTTGRLDTSIPLSYWNLYLRNFHNQGGLSSPLKSHLLWTRKEAQKLLAIDRWRDYEKGVLVLLASESIQGAYDQFLDKELYDSPELKPLRERVKKNAEGSIPPHGFGIIYNYQYLSGSLREELQAMHSIGLLIEYNWEDFLVGFSAAAGLSERKSYLRFSNEGELVTSDLESYFHFELYGGYQLWEKRRNHVHLIAGIGYNIFTTDLTFINEFDENQVLNMTSIYPTFGIDYRVQVYGSRSIGLRSQIQLQDFSSNPELRSSLSGAAILGSIYFRL